MSEKNDSLSSSSGIIPSNNHGNNLFSSSEKDPDSLDQPILDEYQKLRMSLLSADSSSSLLTLSNAPYLQPTTQLEFIPYSPWICIGKLTLSIFMALNGLLSVLGFFIIPIEFFAIGAITGSFLLASNVLNVAIITFYGIILRNLVFLMRMKSQFVKQAIIASVMRLVSLSLTGTAFALIVYLSEVEMTKSGLPIFYGLTGLGILEVAVIWGLVSRASDK